MIQRVLTTGRIHFIGIGGIGMSGIAEVMHNLGYQISGSDLGENANIVRLRDFGITVNIGHKAEHIIGAAVIVISTAVKADNLELVAAREHMIPVVRRAEMLAELMRLKKAIAIGGTHGKTTTTSLIAQILDKADFDPTVVNGGIINAYGTNARLGSGEWLIAEADESDGTFVKLPATIAVVTNIDPEHMDHYGNVDKLHEAFDTFVENIPFYGFAMLCMDHPEVQALVGRVEDRRLITYGLSPQAEVRAVNLHYSSTGSKFDVNLNIRNASMRTICNIYLPMHGEYNVQNALAAIGIAAEIGIDDTFIRQALASFSGVKRRFTRTGTWNDIVIIDDYAHHPVEISAVLRAARQATSHNIIAVMQPHRYTRLESLFENFCSCFNNADRVIIAPVYEAGEKPIEGITHQSLAEGLQKHGHRDVRTFSDPLELPNMIYQVAQPGDFVICLGAGNITQWANDLPVNLKNLSTQYGSGPEVQSKAKH